MTAITTTIQNGYLMKAPFYGYFTFKVLQTKINLPMDTNILHSPVSVLPIDLLHFFFDC